MTADNDTGHQILPVLSPPLKRKYRGSKLCVASLYECTGALPILASVDLSLWSVWQLPPELNKERAGERETMGYHTAKGAQSG